MVLTNISTVSQLLCQTYTANNNKFNYKTILSEENMFEFDTRFQLSSFTSYVQSFSKCLVCILSLPLCYSLSFLCSWILSKFRHDTREIFSANNATVSFCRYTYLSLNGWVVLFWRWFQMKKYYYCRFSLDRTIHLIRSVNTYNDEDRSTNKLSI